MAMEAMGLATTRPSDAHSPGPRQPQPLFSFRTVCLGLRLLPDQTAVNSSPGRATPCFRVGPRSAHFPGPGCRARSGCETQLSSWKQNRDASWRTLAESVSTSYVYRTGFSFHKPSCVAGGLCLVF